MGFARCINYVRDSFKFNAKSVLIFLVKMLNILRCFRGLVDFVRIHSPSLEPPSVKD